MIDLHTHILHQIDDGPPALDGSIEMARVALADGITTMAATPHGRSSVGGWNYSVALLRERLETVRAALADENLPLAIVPGTECYADADLPERLAAGELLSFGDSRAVLIEFPNNAPPALLEQTVFAMQLARYRVLIAHPERIKAVQSDPNVLLPIIERGALAQLTAEALVGGQGATLQYVAEVLVAHRLVQVLSSDAHGRHLSRMPLLSPARARAAELVGAEAAEAMVLATPQALLSDGPLNLPPPQTVRDYAPPRRFW